jgi:PhzF family phenazine biosynthesis protein
LLAALGGSAVEVLKADDYLVVYEDEEEIRGLRPDLQRLLRLDARGVIVTAPSDEVDFVSRFFAPKFGVPEDPVTGSAHCTLAPYWAERLGKDRLHARQLSRRGGEVWCEVRGERVEISGRAVLYLSGSIRI